MKQLFDLTTIKDLYDKGENLMEYFKSKESIDRNTLEHILISYDFQSGSYIKFIESYQDYSNNYTNALSAILNELNFNSLLEIGVGEATTLGNLMPKLSIELPHIYGLDISWSRLRYGISYLKDKGGENCSLFVADLFNIPVCDNAIDVVYTSHSIEPNGGREKEALESLYRVASKYLVLLEPSYHFGSEKAKERITKNGYVKTLYKTAIDLGYNVIEYRLFDHYFNDLNPTELIIIEKKY